MISAKPVAMVAILWLAHLAVPVPLLAQGVTVKATALTEIKLQASTRTVDIDVLRAGSDMTSGVSLRAAVQGSSSPSSTLDFAIEQTSEYIRVRLSEIGRASGTLGSGGASTSISPYRIQVDFQSPRPMRGRLIVRSCFGTHGTASYSSQLSILGQEPVFPSRAGYPFCRLAGTLAVLQTRDVVIDASPFSLVFETVVAFAAAGGGGRGAGGGGFDNCWELELVPDPSFPCEIESYGATCGAVLTAVTDFDHPGQVVVTLEDPSLPPLAALGIGWERRSIPIPGWGCTLYNELVAYYPWSIDPTGKAVVVFEPPPFPGATFKIQAATLQGATLHATNGLDFLIR